LIIRFREQANTDLVTGIASDRRLRDDIQQRIKQAEPNGWLLDIRIPDLGPMTDLTSLSQIEQLETAFCPRLDSVLTMDHLLARRGAGQYTARFHHSGDDLEDWLLQLRQTDRKSTRLNSSHVKTSYAVFCLKKKNERLGHSPLATGEPARDQHQRQPSPAR